MRRLVREDSGTAAVEFAIIFPVLALILGGAIEVGSLVQTVAIVRNAAREGARYASVGDPNATANAVAYLSASLAGRNDVTLGSATATLNPSGGAAPGSPVTVTVSVPLTIQMPVISNILGTTMTLTSDATMEVI